jgi:hypothetical protein
VNQRPETFHEQQEFLLNGHRILDGIQTLIDRPDSAGEGATISAL